MKNEEEKVYRIPSYFSPIPASENKTVLKSPNQLVTLTIRKEVVSDAIDLLQDGATVRELAEIEGLSKKQAYAVINLLKDKGVLVEGEENNLLADYYERYYSTSQVAQHLEGKKLVFIGAGPVADRLLRSFEYREECDIAVWDNKKVKSRDAFMYRQEVETGQDRVDLVQSLAGVEIKQGSLSDLETVLGSSDLVVLCDDRGDKRLQMKINDICVEQDTELFPVLYEEDRIKIGPYVMPGQKSCLNCLEDRISSNSDAISLRAEYVSYKQDNESRVIVPSRVLGIVESMAVDELISILSGLRKPASLGTVLECGLFPPKLESHKVVKNPFCSVCGIEDGN